MLVDSANATIQLNQNSLNETFVVQLTTVRESVESSLTTPIMQCKKVVYTYKPKCCNTFYFIIDYVDINPLYSIEETSISTSSATLQCRLACLTEDLQCIITSLQPAPDMNVNKTAQQLLVLEGLQESTMYQYCVSAYNNVTNELIGFSVCGTFETTTGNFERMCALTKCTYACIHCTWVLHLLITKTFISYCTYELLQQSRSITS